MGLDELVANIAAKNRLARDRASARVSALIDVTVKGTADEFSSVVKDFLDSTGDRGSALEPDEPPEAVGGDGGDAVLAAGSG